MYVCMYVCICMVIRYAHSVILVGIAETSTKSADSVLEFKAEKFAQQLTIIEMEFFRRIYQSEFVSFERSITIGLTIKKENEQRKNYLKKKKEKKRKSL